MIESVDPAKGRIDLSVDESDGGEHTLAAETSATVAKFDRLVFAGAGSRGNHGSSARSGLEQHVGFDGRIAA